MAGEVAAVATRLGVTHVDLFHQLAHGGLHLRLALSDGLHLSNRGADVLLSLLLPVFNDKLGNSKLQLPDWKELDNKDPVVL